MIKINLKLVLLLFGVIFMGSYLTSAYFSSDQEVNGMSFSTGSWANSSDVVINELMWPGSVEVGGYDEWIELRNLTNSEIDLTGWKLTKVNSLGVESLMLNLSGKISPRTENGFLVISNFDKDNSAIKNPPNIVDSGVTLADENLKIKLYSGAWNNPANLVDTAGNGGPALAGLNQSSKKSMSRKTDPGQGVLAEDWFTSQNNSTDYWDIAGLTYGTPGGPNE